ncbi:putative transcriptional regulator, MarR family [Aeropyrum pernix K1]|uniref:Transcriptional regulator, MarR family n=1 Tax=Aeropyrum pernix (strain ATCC 700893 / DSM 11879 / JCM 9820 / NBRC 100138 / K1) TaxID=272557 RepID=Q9YFF3_AERPE|nr:MarR family transcriptional regulator [Aeropyrum pernix]BAA79243.1 putative transcriptional regulator, MarR family [Aeropyrum pernix K1]
MHEDDVSIKIVSAIERIARAYRILIARESYKHGLTPLQASILLYIYNSPPNHRTISSLVRELGVKQPTISDSVRALISKGLVTYEPHRSDRRVKILKLTPKGVEIAESLKSWQTVAAEAVDLSRGEREALLELLLKYMASLYRYGVIEVARTCFTCTYLEAKNRGEGVSYYCSLLKRELGRSGLRVDCPEHSPKRI